MMPPPMMTTRAWVGKLPAISEPPPHGGVVHLAHLRHARLDRIAARRRIGGRHLRELVEMLDLHAELAKGMRDPEFAPQVERPLHEAVEGGRAKVEPAGEPHDLLLDGRAIELHDI